MSPAILRLATAVATLIAWLLVGANGALAAVDQVPRMERVNACDWDRPGHNPFMGDVVAAIDRYTDIPTPIRIKLKQRMQARRYDDLVDIRRDTISGRERYEAAIRDMHFGVDRVCHQVTRERWTAQMVERGLVYCEAGHCILVPTVCRNVSRIERRPTRAAQTGEGGPPDGQGLAAPPSSGLPAANADRATTAAVAPPPPTAMANAESVAAPGAFRWPTDGNAPAGGYGGNRVGGGRVDITDGRGGSVPLWPLVSGGWGGGTGGASFGGLIVIGDLLQSARTILPCLASGGSGGGNRVASGWRNATGAPARLARRRHRPDQHPASSLTLAA